MNPWEEDRSDSYVLNFCSNPRKANVTKESELQIWIHIYSQKMVRIFFLDALGEKRKTGWVASTLLKAQFWGDPHWGQNRKDGSTGDEHDQQSIIGAVGVQSCCLLLDVAGGSLKLLRLASWSVRDTGMRNPQVSHAIAGLSPLQRHKGMKKARNTLSYSTRSDEPPHRGHTANPFSKTFRTSWVTPPKKKKNISLLDSIRSLLVFSFFWNNTKQNLHNPIKTFNARSLFLSTHPLFHLVLIRTKYGHLNLQGGKNKLLKNMGSNCQDERGDRQILETPAPFQSSKDSLCMAIPRMTKKDICEVHNKCSIIGKTPPAQPSRSVMCEFCLSVVRFA